MDIEQDETLDSSIVYVHHKRAMIGEGVLWNRVGTEGTPRRGGLDSFAQMVSEVSRTSVAACRGGSFRLRKRGESGGGTARGTLVQKEVK